MLSSGADTTDMQSQGRTWRHFAIVGLCLALTYVFGVSGLKAHPATHEEWDSIKHLSTSQLGPINSIAETVESVISISGKVHAPGYFVLLNLWSRLAGLDLFALRLSSVFFGLFALVFTYRLALLLGTPDTAVDAALLVAFTAFVSYYIHIVRLYSLLPALSVVVLWSYWRVSSAAGAAPRRLWIAFIVACAAILWVHYFGTVLLAALGLYHLVFARRNRHWFRICLALIGAGLLFAPWLPVFFEGLLRRSAPASDALPFIDAALAIASIYSNGLPIVFAVVGIVAALNFRRLNRSRRYIFIVVAAIALLLLIGNEVAPLLVARRIRYAIVLALPLACALAIALNLIPRWRLLRIPFLALWIAAYAAYSNSEQLLLYTNWLNLGQDHVPPYHDLLYEPGFAIEKSDFIISFHPDSAVLLPVHAYYDSFHGRWSGLKHIWTLSDGIQVVQTAGQTMGSIADVANWNFRAWVVYNPLQTDLDSMSAYTDVFLQHFNSCGRYVEKRESVIELYGPRDVPCDLLTTSDSPGARIRYDNGSVLGNASSEVDSDRLTVSLWWANTVPSVYAYSLQLFDEAGAKTGPQKDSVISDKVVYVEDLDVSMLPAGEYAVKLVVYNYQSFESQPGLLAASNERFARDVEIARFSLGS